MILLSLSCLLAGAGILALATALRCYWAALEEREGAQVERKEAAWLLEETERVKADLNAAASVYWWKNRG